jgi:hypothetical protein
VPSRSDLAGALDAGWIHLIVSLAGSVPQLRGWRIVAGEATEIPMTIVEDE